MPKPQNFTADFADRTKQKEGVKSLKDLTLFFDLDARDDLVFDALTRELAPSAARRDKFHFRGPRLGRRLLESLVGYFRLTDSLLNSEIPTSDLLTSDLWLLDSLSTLNYQRSTLSISI